MKRSIPLLAACLMATLALSVCAAPPQPPDAACGLSPSDWCTKRGDDPCGKHADEKSCRADRKCRGLPYRGESVEACMEDGSGFWKNCPAVGCVSR